MKRTPLPLQRRDFIAGLGAAAWPVVARAQQPARPVIGLLHSRSAEAAVQVNEALREGLRDFGFVEGRNVSIEYRFAAGHFDLLPALAADLVSRRPAPSPSFSSGALIRLRWDALYDAGTFLEEDMKRLLHGLAFAIGIVGLAHPLGAKVVKFEILRTESPAFEGRAGAYFSRDAAKVNVYQVAKSG